MRLSRTAKSCGSGAPTLALSSWEYEPTDDGGKRARSPGRARISRNTIVQGMPADAVYPWLLTPVLFSAQAATGATRIRHSLRPLLWRAGDLGSKLARNRRRDREAVAAKGSRPGGLFDNWMERTHRRCGGETRHCSLRHARRS